MCKTAWSSIKWMCHMCGTQSYCLGFLSGASHKEPACQCWRHKRRGFDPWVGKIPWRRAWQPTPVLLPGESPWTEEPGGLQFVGSQSQTRPKQLSTQHTGTQEMPLPPVSFSSLFLFPPVSFSSLLPQDSLRSYCSCKPRSVKKNTAFPENQYMVTYVTEHI